MVLTLPFVMKLEENGQEAPISDGVETGLILSLVESKREKGGGFLRKKDAEDVPCVSKLYWPLFLIKRPDKDKYILFDMLGVFEQTFDYKTLPETTSIISDLQRNGPSNVHSKEYISLLKSSENSLKDFAGSIQTTFAGCFAHEDLLKDLLSYLHSIDDTELSEVLMVPSHLSIEQMEKSIGSMLDLKQKSSEDIESLHEIENTVFSISSNWNTYLTRKQSETIAYFNEKIEEIRPEVESAVAEYRSRMNSEIQSLELRFSPLISNYQAEVARWKREEDMYKRLGETHARQRDSVRKSKKESENQLKRTEREYHKEIENTKRHYLNLIESELDRIRSLEKKRDDNVKELQKKKDEIEKRTEKVEKRIDKLIQRKNGFIGAIDEVGLEILEIDALRDAEKSLLYLPIYVAQFQTDSKTRHLICPPMIIRGEKKATEKLKGLFGGVTLPIEPRTKRFDKIFKNKVEKCISEDTTLQREISEKSVQCNILTQSRTKEKYLKALQELRELGWIKDKHYNEFSSAFEKHFAS